MFALAALLSLACGSSESTISLVEIAPASPAMDPGATVRFVAQVAGTPETAEWSVAETNGGTIDGAGNYTAPADEGTYTIVASLPSIATVQTTRVRVRHGAGTPSTPASPVVEGPFADVTAFGAKGDGVTDDTAAFQKAAATKLPLLVPKPSAHYRLTGKVRVYDSVVGKDLPEIRMYGANGTDAKAMFEVQDYTGAGMVFRGLKLDGQYDGVGTAGEYSHLIIVKGSSNVFVEDNVLLRPYGDGVYLGGGSNPRPSRNVVVRNNRIEAPRRCTVAVISVVGAKIEGNTLKKSNTYVANIDVEPNPKAADFIDGVEISSNTIDAPGTKAILLYTWTENPAVNRNVRITGNTLRGRWGVRRNPTGSSWENIYVGGNRYEGDPNGPAAQVSFVDIQTDTSTGEYVSNVTVEKNIISIAPRSGVSHRDSVANVKGVKFAGNQYVGTMSYRATVSSSSNVTVSGNAPSSVVTVQ